MNKVNAETPAASAVASAVAPEDLESGFLPEDPEYRKTGKLSEKDDDEKDKKDDKSGAGATEENEEEETEQENADKEAASAAATEEEKDADNAAASAAASTQEKDKGSRKTPETSENRYRKLSRENRELKEKVARLEGREEGRASSTTQQPRETEQRSQPAADGKTPKPKLDDVDQNGKPKYATYADYENARDDWNRKEAIREFQEQSSTTERQRNLQAAEAEIGKQLAKKFETARTKYKDFNEVALNNDLVIPKGSVTDAFLIDSDHAADVLYHLGQHPEILEGFYGDHDIKSGRFVNKISQQRQFRKLIEIEAEVSKPAPAKKITNAPRPPNQVDGKNAVTKNARDQAIEDGDSSTYISDANASDPRLAAVRASRKKG